MSHKPQGSGLRLERREIPHSQYSLYHGEEFEKCYQVLGFMNDFNVYTKIGLIWTETFSEGKV